MKYIIKNCPAIYNSDILNNACNDLTNYNVCSCENTSDCILKRIAKLCKDEECEFADEILKLLEIEEVDEPKY